MFRRRKKKKFPAITLIFKYDSNMLYICSLEGHVGKFPKASRFRQRAEKWPNVSVPLFQLSNPFQMAGCGASFMAAVAPEPLLPGYNRLACCFNKRGRFGGWKEERRRGDGGGGGRPAGNHIQSHSNSWGSDRQRRSTFAAHDPVHTWEQSRIIARSWEAVTSLHFVFNCLYSVWKLTQL